MKYFTRKLTNKVGLPPGEIVYSGEEKQPTTVTLYQYDEKTFVQKNIETISEIDIDESKVNWLNISGFGNHGLIMDIIAFVDIHRILAEDIFHMDHLPKYEEHENSALFILKSYLSDSGTIQSNQSSLFLNNNIVISFQEYPNTLLDKKIERINSSQGKTRLRKADYLFFLLIDAFVDSYYNLFEEIRDEISNIEDILFTRKRENCVDVIYELNKKLHFVRKGIIPLRDAVKTLLVNDINLIEDKNLIYYKDIANHVDELIHFYESFGGLVKGLIDLNENNMNKNTNEVMKMLTIVASIFIPLTFIAGIYGMNFENIPELSSKNGYFITLVAMFVVASGLIVYMRYKKWF